MPEPATCVVDAIDNAIGNVGNASNVKQYNGCVTAGLPVVFMSRLVISAMHATACNKPLTHRAELSDTLL